MLFNVTYFVAVGHNNIRLIQSQASLLEVEGEAGGGVDGREQLFAVEKWAG